MVEQIKKNKYKILEIIIIFLITLLFTLMCKYLSNDEIWSYGFSYNIATGLIPYKDFNMVITPLFPMLSSIFLILFGKNIVVFHIFNAIICTTIFYFMKKRNSKKLLHFVCDISIFFIAQLQYFLHIIKFIINTYEKKETIENYKIIIYKNY